MIFFLLFYLYDDQFTLDQTNINDFKICFVYLMNKLFIFQSTEKIQLG